MIIIVIFNKLILFYRLCLDGIVKSFFNVSLFFFKICKRL